MRCCTLLFLAMFIAQLSAGPPSVLFVVADDWSYPHAGAYGDIVARTPHFDRVAREGLLFDHCYCASPSCSPSRASLLTGQHPHRLADGANLWGTLPAQFETLPDRLEKHGYAVGHCGKGWGPGSVENRPRNPAGPSHRTFAQFLTTVKTGQPFWFWVGSRHPHRPYELDSGIEAGYRPDAVKLPSYWPDTPAVRRDLLDYYAAAERFDNDLGQALTALEAAGRAADTIVVVTSDNGLPFPRCKANLYDGGTRMPLAVRWPGRIAAGARTTALVSHTDFAPTLSALTGTPPLAEATGRDLSALWLGRDDGHALEAVVIERERHANVRVGDGSYPARGLRTRDTLYIRNFRPDRWPGGDPQLHVAVGPYGDCDEGPCKTAVSNATGSASFALCFGKRPAEELYDLRTDLEQIHNLASDPAHAALLERERERLLAWLRQTGDPRAFVDDDRWDRMKYYGASLKEERRGKAK